MFKRLARVGALALLGLLAAAPIALAGLQVAGATYKGHVMDGLNRAISFKVTKDGKDVTNISISGPLKFDKCHGPGWTRVGNPKASISNKGHFSVVVHYKFAQKGSSATVTLSGAFHKNAKESGTATVAYPAVKCDGSASYHTHVS